MLNFGSRPKHKSPACKTRRPVCCGLLHCMMLGELAGRLALVTGGGSGIGGAVCRLFAQHGCRVAVADISESNAQGTVTELEGDHESFVVDVSSKSSVETTFANIKERFSEVPSIIVNSAGITRDKLLLELDEEMFDQVIQVNLKGTFLVTQAAALAMKDARVDGGSIVNVASIVGKLGNIGQANYTASKAGVEGLTRTSAKELARFGIRCNAILPGFIDTPMTQVVPEKIKKRLLPTIALRRLGDPKEVAETCLFLASSRSSYITGVSLEVTGGLSM